MRKILIIEDEEIFVDSLNMISKILTMMLRAPKMVQ